MRSHTTPLGLDVGLERARHGRGSDIATDDVAVTVHVAQTAPLVDQVALIGGRAARRDHVGLSDAGTVFVVCVRGALGSAYTSQPAASARTQ